MVLLFGPEAFLAGWGAWTDLGVCRVPASRSRVQTAPETTVQWESPREHRSRNPASTLELCAALGCHGILALSSAGLCVCKKLSVHRYHLA